MALRCSALGGGYSIVAVYRFLIAVASLVAEHGLLGPKGFSNCDAGAWLPQGMWNPPRPGLNLSPA